MTVHASTPIELIGEVYDRLPAAVARGRERLGRALTLSEKILVAHLDDETQPTERGVSYVDLRVDRVAMQDATAQMAWLQFMTAGLERVAVPTTTHCDHLITARTDGRTDLATAESANGEVYDFLESVSARYGAGFWKPGSGIIHQVVLEQYAFPGGMMIGTDSHTPNAGGLAMVAIGVGGADAVDVMTGNAWNVRWPKMIGVRLTGQLSGWASPKDVILKVAEILTVKGGTGAIVEYFGPGAATLSCTGKATICNMGAEIGATTSLFGYDWAMARYLRATDRAAVADAANRVAAELTADREVVADPHSFYDQVIDVDLSALGPRINGPHTPDLAREVNQLGDEARREGWPTDISAALIGSCTNSSYEDITRAASIARQAAAAGLTAKTQLMVTPGSEQIRATIERDGLLADFEQLGAVVLANACGPCIGQWDRSDDPDYAQGQPNVIVTSYNRNFPKRNDGDPATLAFVASPETVMALALAGTLDFDPVSGSLSAPDGTEVRLAAPQGIELPPRGFEGGESGFVAPPADGSAVSVVVRPDSDRLAVLAPFPAWNGDDYESLVVLVKAKGKFTTDHISMAGPWLRYRGHLENISGNLYLGAVNAFDGYEVGCGKNQLTGATQQLPDIAQHYHREGVGWVVIGDENMGEGSSREHAAMEPRYRGGLVAIARSFARIHETNLKKQGMLALTFADPADYDRIGEDDRIAVRGLAGLAPNVPVTVEVSPGDGATWSFEANHTMSADQIEWFKAGSALNVIRATPGQGVPSATPDQGVPKDTSTSTPTSDFSDAPKPAPEFPNVRTIDVPKGRIPDEVLFDLLRAAAEVNGNDGKLSGNKYEAVADTQRFRNWPTRQTFALRFGSWNEACAKAGLSPHKPWRSNYVRKHTEETCWEWVDRFLSSGHGHTFAHLDEWLREQPGSPSSATVRIRLGKWKDVRDEWEQRRSSNDPSAYSSVGNEPATAPPPRQPWESAEPQTP